MVQSKKNIAKLIRELSEIGIALSAEKNHNHLLELILTKAMEITNSDGGTLYSRTNDNKLKFEIMYNRSLKIHKGGTSAETITFYPIHLYDNEGKPNKTMVAAWAANSGKTINIPDAYAAKEFEFSGTRKFDKKTNYRSTSYLTVPMRNHENDIIGILQLINAMDEKGNIIPFSELDQQLVESLASQAAVTITNKKLIRTQKDMFDSFIELIANAIDEKSPYTAGHCRRVPILTNMLSNAAIKTDQGSLKNFKMTDDEKYALEVAAWLHDCGKITTPEYLVDKATKLEAIFDRINLIDVRFEVLKRDTIIKTLKTWLEKSNNNINIDETLHNDSVLQKKLNELEQEKKDLHQYNIGSTLIEDNDLDKIAAIAKRTWVNSDHKTINLLSNDEVKNLGITYGTLTIQERKIINNHISVTIKMLKSLPYPKHLMNVPEYAGGHHEKMDGTGYPNQLTKEQMSVPARMLAIADIFEALTAGDRPYKKAMSLSESLKILGQMKVNNHIDADLFNVFMDEKVYLDYAKQYLHPNQIDEINFADIPGYTPLN